MSESGDRPAAAAGNPAEDPALLFEHLWRLGRQPNVQDFLRTAGQLTPAQIVSVLCIDQWKRWQIGDRVAAEVHLAMHPSLQGTDDALDLIFGEFLLREELDESPQLQEYLDRFPQYAAQLKKQFDFHRAIESPSLVDSMESELAAESKPAPPPPRTAPAKAEDDASVISNKPPAPPGVQGRPTIPGYEILSELGRGGMGQVFKARHQRLNRIVALKVIRQERLSQDPEAVRRFQREARAAAQLTHPNVVVVYDADQVEGNYFIAMEYVEGIDLFEYVKEAGPLPIEQACDYIRQACLGLQHAFERGMVHRDIKPSNLLVTMPKLAKGMSGFHVLPTIPDKAADQPGKEGKGAASPLRRVRPLGLSSLGTGPAGVVKILDMGLALVTHNTDSQTGQWTQEGTLMGTPDYIAPEQAVNSHSVDIRADLYSLGCTLYYLLCGKPPFGDYPLIQKLMMHQMTGPKPIEELRPDTPPKVRAILGKLLAKRPEERYQTPLELSDALASLKVADFAVPSDISFAQPIEPATTSGAESTKGPATPTIPPPDKSTSPTEVFPPRADPAPPAKASKPPDTAPEKHADIIMKWSGGKKPEPVAKEQEGIEKAKKICVLEGHRGWVTSVAFSLDRSTLASGGVDGALRLWDLAGAHNEPKDRQLPQAHSSDLTAVTFAPDNKTLATGAGTLDGVVWLWDIADKDPRPIAPIRVGSATVECLAFSPDSRSLAIGGSDKNVRLWDVSTTQPQAGAVLKGHTDFVKAIVFSTDGKLLASAGKDSIVRVWNLSRYWSKEQALIQGRWGQVQGLSFAPDDKSLAFGSLDQTVRIWHLGESGPHERLILRGHVGVVRLVHFNGDATLLSVCDGGRIILWDTSKGEKLREWLLPRAKVYSMTVTQDGRYLATGNNDGSVFLYRLYPKRASSSADMPPPAPATPTSK